MPSSLNLMESAAQDRHAERYRRTRRTYGGTAAPGRSSAEVRANAEVRPSARVRTGAEVRPLETARRRAGWLLVDLGLRLISSGRPGARRPHGGVG
jgi:hypothetical protein